MLGELVTISMHLGIGVIGLWLSVIDLREHRLPNLGTGSLALLLGVAGLASQQTGELEQGVLAAALSAGLFALGAALPPQALGWGDVKLQVSLGFYLGFLEPSLVIVQLMAAFIVGGGAGLVGVLRGSHRWSDPIAFGPCLVAGAAIAVLAGEYGKII